MSLIFMTNIVILFVTLLVTILLLAATVIVLAYTTWSVSGDDVNDNVHNSGSSVYW